VTTALPFRREDGALPSMPMIDEFHATD